MTAFDMTAGDGLAMLVALAVLVLPMALAWWIVWRWSPERPTPDPEQAAGSLKSVVVGLNPTHRRSTCAPHSR